MLAWLNHRLTRGTHGDAGVAATSSSTWETVSGLRPIIYEAITRSEEEEPEQIATGVMRLAILQPIMSFCNTTRGSL